MNSKFSLRASLRFFSYLASTLFVSFLFGFISSSSASAAPTVVTGTISGIPDDSYGIAWAEKYISGEWVEITASYTKDLYKGQGYKVNLGEASGSDVRIWAQFGSTGSGFISGTDSFTVTSTAMTKNFSLAVANFQVNVSNPLACSRGSINVKSSTAGTSDKFGLWAQMNETGTVNLSLPVGYSFDLVGKCNGDISFSSAVTATSTLQTVPITIATPNVVGTISGITSKADIDGRVQSRIFDGISTKWRTV